MSEIKNSAHRYRSYPVFDDTGGFAGFAKSEDIFKPENSDLICAEIISSPPKTYITADTSITKAANYMIERDVLELAVVDELSPEKLLGILTLHDIARQQNASEPFDK